MASLILGLPSDPKEAGLIHGKTLQREVHKNLSFYRS
jgi:hypothetical protein